MASHVAANIGLKGTALRVAADMIDFPVFYVCLHNTQCTQKFKTNVTSARRMWTSVRAPVAGYGVQTLHGHAA
jgi:hypothetical protein